MKQIKILSALLILWILLVLAFPASRVQAQNLLTTIQPVVQSAANWTMNIVQFGGTNISTGLGPSGAGIPRVTPSLDDMAGTVSLTAATACPAASTTVTTSAGCIVIPIAGFNGAGVEIQAGTLAASLTYEFSTDGGTTWNASIVIIGGVQLLFPPQSVFTNPNANTDVNFFVGEGWSHVRARVSAFTSGAATIWGRATKLTSPLAIGAISAAAPGSAVPFFVTMPGLKAQTGVPAAVVNAAAVNANGDVYGVPFVRLDHPNRIHCVQTISTAVALTLVPGCGAPGAALSIYITDINFSTNVGAIATDTFNTLKYGTQTTNPCDTGTTVFWGAFTPATTQAVVIQPRTTPIKIPANNQVCWINSTAGSKFVELGGWIAP